MTLLTFFGLSPMATIPVFIVLPFALGVWLLMIAYYKNDGKKQVFPTVCGFLLIAVAVGITIFGLTKGF